MKALLVVSVLAASASAHAGGTSAVAHKQEIAERTVGILDKKVDERRDALRRRLASAYRMVSRSGSHSWLSNEQRKRRARTRAALRSVVGWEAGELAIIEKEQRLALEGRERLAELAGRSLATPRWSHRPVAGAIAAAHGRYRHKRTTLFRPGIEMVTQAGEAVLAPASGTVVFSGEIGGVGRSLILEDEQGFLIVLGGIESRVHPGGTVAAGQPVGSALGRRLRVELRFDVDGAIVALNPTAALPK